jgi:hypothetical protein
MPKKKFKELHSEKQNKTFNKAIDKFMKSTGPHLTLKKYLFENGQK